MERIGGILGGVLRETGASELLLLAEIENHWADIVGEALARKVRPLKLAKGTLYLATENPAWAQEALFVQRAILGEIEKQTGCKLRGLRTTAQRPIVPRESHPEAVAAELKPAEKDPQTMLERARASYQRSKEKEVVKRNRRR